MTAPKPKDRKYKWLRVRDFRIPDSTVRAGGWPDNGERKLFAVGILADGTLYNPNNYPDDIVRTAVLAAIEQQHEWQSQAAKKAAITRRERTARKIYAVAKRLTDLNGAPTGPRNNCVICGRGLADQQSIDRGIGSECWQDVLTEIARRRARGAA